MEDINLQATKEELSVTSPTVEEFEIDENGNDVTSPPPPPNISRNIGMGPTSDLSSSLNYLSDQNYKYLSVPLYGEENNLLNFAEEDDILERIHQRESNLLFNKLVSYGISITLLASVITVIVLAVNHTFTGNSGGDNDDSPLPDTCYIAPSCFPDELTTPAYNPQTGFTNYTGWNWHEPYTYQCCNICPKLPDSSSSSSLSEQNKNNNYNNKDNKIVPPNPNYDYLVFDQIWLPQFCYALFLGHDPTLSHLIGSQCQEFIYQTMEPQLIIHGLWPNRETGSSVSCCIDLESKEVPTLDPALPMTWPFYDRLMAEWFDPTTNESYFNTTSGGGTKEIGCSTCYLLNHEWQKHGSCFGAFSLLDENQFHYFESGLSLAALLDNQTKDINSLSGTTVKRSDIEALFAPHKVNVMCDPQDTTTSTEENTGVFLEIQSCWDLEINETSSTSSSLSYNDQYNNHLRRLSTPPFSPSGGGMSGGGFSGNYSFNFSRIDCPSVFNSVFSSECPDQVFLRNFFNPFLSMSNNINRIDGMVDSSSYHQERIEEI
jgi:ribonuclease I